MSKDEIVFPRGALVRSPMGQVAEASAFELFDGICRACRSTSIRSLEYRDGVLKAEDYASPEVYSAGAKPLLYCANCGQIQGAFPLQLKLAPPEPTPDYSYLDIPQVLFSECLAAGLVRVVCEENNTTTAELTAKGNAVLSEAHDLFQKYAGVPPELRIILEVLYRSEKPLTQKALARKTRRIMGWTLFGETGEFSRDKLYRLAREGWVARGTKNRQSCWVTTENTNRMMRFLSKEGRG